MKYIVSLLMLIAGVMTGCKPYMTPVYADIKANETAYVIPLEDGPAKEVKFDSEAYLESKKVGMKRIPLAQRWNQTGYIYLSGTYIPLQRVITVDRTPTTRQWQPGKNSKEALWLESMDSIGFSTGFSITAYIDEHDTSRFLYSYKSDTLAHVLDTEGRARIQSVASVVAASYKMDELRERKNELIAKVRDDILPYFKSRGITIPTIGQFGGFEYENEKIQSAIDGTFVAQQEKVTNKARLDAQHDANERIKSEAEATAEAARLKAKGEADGKLSVFNAEAQGLQAVNKALSEANQNPALVELKRIDVQKLQAERWDGHYPAWYMPGASGQGLLLNVNPPSR